MDGRKTEARSVGSLFQTGQGVIKDEGVLRINVRHSVQKIELSKDKARDDDVMPLRVGEGTDQELSHQSHCFL